MQTQRESVRRDTSHQRVILEIDFNGSLWGYTEITIVPTTKDLRTVNLHSRQCTIHNVTVAQEQADFVHYDPLANLSTSKGNDVHAHPELKRKLYSALAEGDEGELSIAIPDNAVRASGRGSVAGFGSEGGATPEPMALPTGPGEHFAPITINIEYSLRNPADGLNFVLPSDAYPHRVPHVYTTPTSPDAARCWVPCVDNMWERCTWDLEFVVPRYLEEQDDEDEDVEAQDDHPTVVVCSADFVEQVAHPYNSSKSIFVFSQSTITSAQHIGFAAGPFHVLPIPAELSATEEAANSTQPPMHAFCLPGHESALATTTAFTRQAMSFYTTEFGSYPFGSYKMVFVDDHHIPRHDTATMAIVSVDLLHGEDAIDQVYETRQQLAHALACQWSGINILPKVWSDTWLVNGLGLYMAAQFLRKLLGNNEYRFRLKKDMERTVSLDDGKMPPVCMPTQHEPPDPACLPFINLKAPIILHILDRRLGKSGTSLGLSRVLPKLFLTAISGEMANNALSTHAFLRTCRKVSGVDLRRFAEQWIYGSGCPAFSFTASFNRKKMAVEIHMRQDCPAYLEDEVHRALFKPVELFEGQMTIRIHEADGTPYEHVLDIRAHEKRFEVPFNTKYKRVRRNTKRYLARQQAAQAAAEGDAEAAEAMGMVDISFGLDIWEKERERELWKVADWTEDDENVMNGATYEWIRMDADFEWISSITFSQPDFMWVSQLQRDRDVVAQLEAVNALAKMPNPIVSSTLTKTVLVTNYFFRIRCEAAMALLTCAIRRHDFLGLFHLFKLFLRYCYEPEDPAQDLFVHRYVPRPNDFSDVAEYFVRRALIRTISQVRFENGNTPAVVRSFLVDLLRYNDNTANAYTDAFYICTIISSLAGASVCANPPERGELAADAPAPPMDPEDARLLKEAVAEVDRYRNMDRLIASPHNAVTVASLEFRLVLSTANLIPNDAKIWFPLTREGNYTQVRLAAFDSLFFTKWYTPKIVRYVLAVMAHDSSRLVRRHVARNAVHSLALLVAMGELRGGGKNENEVGPTLIEEDGTGERAEERRKKGEVDGLIKALRKDKEIGKSEALREVLLPLALAPGADAEVRWSVLKLADVLIRGSEEAPPKLSIHIPPPTPIVEAQPPPSSVLPTVKVPVKKAGTPAPGPGTPVPPSIKLKLPMPQTPVEQAPPSPALPAAPVVRLPVPRVQFTESRTSSPAPAPTPAPAPKKKALPPPPPPPVPSPAKPRPPKSGPKAQSGGMGIVDLKSTRSVLQKVTQHKAALLFRQPVDPVRDQAPGYFEIIKRPMDLSNMRAKLEAGLYADRFAFEADFRLMIRNAKTYNAPETYVHKEADKLETYFEAQWGRMNKTIEKAQPAVQAKAQRDRAMPPPPVPIEIPVEVKPKARPSMGTPGPSTDVAGAPRLKLKIGGAGTPIAGPSSPLMPATPTPAPKPKPRKPKPAPAPAPSLPDDGTLDLFEEVLAIEKERGAPHPSLLPPGKRKKDATDEDEPSKKRSRSRSPSVRGGSSLKFKTPTVQEGSSKGKERERPSTPSTSSSRPAPVGKPIATPVGKPIATPVGRPIATPVGRPIAMPVGKPIATPPPRPSATPSRPTATPTPKNKTSTPAPRPTATPSRPSGTPAHRPSGTPTPASQGAIPINKSKCKDLLRNLQKVPEAAIFARPVDPIMDGCPTYFEEIKHPMDLRTMEEKLKRNDYATMDQFEADMNLILTNCRTFNPPGTYPTDCADALERAFKKEWAKVMERKLSYPEKRSLQALMGQIVKEDISFVFREPVDPVLLGIPTYFEVIPRKDARDLRTIRTKLERDQYDSVAAWDADIDLMIQNAVHFNGTDSEVGILAGHLRQRVDELLVNLRPSGGGGGGGGSGGGASKKRKEGGANGTPSASNKKAKFA